MPGKSSESSSSLLESHKGYDPRVILFYFIIALLLVVLASGIAYQQLFKADVHHDRERMQS